MSKFLRSRIVGEAGIALPLVIAMGTLMGIMVVTAIGYGINGASQSRNTQEWDASLAAAYAGVEEYQSRIAADPAYWKYGNPASEYTVDSGSATTVIAPPTANPAFGIGDSGTWANVAGSDQAARFRYEVDNSRYDTEGILKIRSTGVVGDSTRTIVADLKQKGFLDFLYLTDYEIVDPAQLPSGTVCAPEYKWAVPVRPGCTELTFPRTDVLNGPVHSNDTIQICGARFRGVVTTSNTALPSFISATGCPAPVWDIGEATYGPTLGLPDTNSEIKKETRSDLPNDVPKPGCLYTGPTTIELLDTGRMIVRSPWTKSTNVSGGTIPTGGTAPAACGVTGSAAGQLGHANGANIPVPTNNVVYVQNIPLITPSTLPNGWSNNATGTGVSCKNRFSGDPVTGNGVGFPMSNEIAPSTSTTSPSYGCRNGDVFVKGELKGQLTIAAENYIYITGNIRYDDPQRDMLGLIGQNSVFVYNPRNSSNTPLLGGGVNRVRHIDAAIFSVAHTFTVQNYAVTGILGTLEVNGSIAQKFRGAVVQFDSRTGNVISGYSKLYLYDNRFRYTAPPKFLSPVTTAYGVTVWVETERAFLPSGAPAP